MCSLPLRLPSTAPAPIPSSRPTPPIRNPPTAGRRPRPKPRWRRVSRAAEPASPACASPISPGPTRFSAACWAAGGEVTLDPVAGQPAGPERSYIGPQSLAIALARLADLAAERPSALPGVLNLAQPGAIAMGDLVTAAGLPWRLGPNPAPAPRVVVDTARLQALAPLPPATAEGLVAELASLQGSWP